MAKKKTYKPLSKQELALYKKNKQIIESRREPFTNSLLKLVKKVQDNKTNDSESLKVKVKYFNKYLKNKKTNDVTKVINYWMSDYEN